MYSPDLIQRIYFEKENGDDSNFRRVFSDLRGHDFDFIDQFDFDGRIIFWTCFESMKYQDIIDESDGRAYFYLWDTELEFEVVMPAWCNEEEQKKNTFDRNPNFHSIWIIGKFFPGLSNVEDRPVKINLQTVKRVDIGPIRKLNFFFKKLMEQYAALKNPIFEPIDYPSAANGYQKWKKLVEKGNKKN